MAANRALMPISIPKARPALAPVDMPLLGAASAEGLGDETADVVAAASVAKAEDVERTGADDVSTMSEVEAFFKLEVEVGVALGVRLLPLGVGVGVGVGAAEDSFSEDERTSGSVSGLLVGWTGFPMMVLGSSGPCV